MKVLKISVLYIDSTVIERKVLYTSLFVLFIGGSFKRGV